ncbi:hypothetical protein C7K25_14740 [Gulosibacter molinativorax]|uniref:Integrase catalytic domain-containing protein n=2 Tax=Gulosibacter molinativorax TaxID=256821 RepID=A0ABT7CBS8_9MICO|nr:hypothetical protein [Gulosibacter molinativorax]
MPKPSRKTMWSRPSDRKAIPIDNAMAEALNSEFKAELIDRQQWSGLIEVMAATSEWVGWYNQRRLHSGIGYLTPNEVHAQHQPMVLAA